MPVRLSTRDQATIRARRKSVVDCYICGTPLLRPGPGGCPVPLIGEHVISLQLLKCVEVAKSDRVPIILDVHKSCEVAHKAASEQLAIDLIRFFALGERDYHCREIGILRAQTRAIERGAPIDGFHKTALSVPAGIASLIELWARGLIAVLYGQSLPESTSTHVSPPVPLLRAAPLNGRGVTNVERWSEMRDLIISSVIQGCSLGTFDELTAWGGCARFTSVWRHLPAVDALRPWTCFWTLELPGYEQWSRQILGYVNPWHGLVSTESLPPEASVLSQADIDRSQAINERRRRAGRL